MSFPHPSGNERESYWLATTPGTSYSPVQADERADVVIIGGGIVGITLSYLLAKAGKSVVVVDRERLATAETGHTTAHLQTVVDTRLKDLIPRFGVEGTKLAWDSQLEAVRLIESIARDERISCDLERLDAYLYGAERSDVRLLRDEIRLARRIGYDAFEAEPSDIPFPAKAAIRFPNQGKFHVRKYLLGVVRKSESMGVRFFEGTEVTEIESGTPAKVHTRDGHTLTGDWVVQATNVPFEPRFLLQSKLSSYRTYAIAARIPRGHFGHALYWDTMDPYHYTRIEPEGAHELVILGGEDHKVGTEPKAAPWSCLAEYLSTVTDDFQVVHRWSGEILETEDDLPYIGRVPGRPENELLATGDSGTGMTNGTIAALMLTERILGRGTPWDELYDPGRVVPRGSPVTEWVKENVSNVAQLAGTAVSPAEVSSVDEIPVGSGAIMRDGLRKVAVARLEDGRLRAVSAVCPHMGCTVAWNAAEASWDCPCHGSRFTPGGEILHGPAKDPLPPADLEALPGERRRAVGDGPSA